MTERVCIVCPRGCRLAIGEGPDYKVTGNACARGAVYGRNEAECPVRTVTATCRAVIREGYSPEGKELPRRVPVRTTGGIPKDRVQELAKELHRLEVTLPVRSGDVIVFDWEHTGVAVTATRDIG